MEDRSVLERFLKDRTEEAFCAVFEAVCVRVNRFFLLRGLDRATAEELTQNVLLKVYRQSGELREPDCFYAWLFSIARNEMISYWRGRQARIETVDLESLAGSGHMPAVDHPAISSLRLADWLQSLDPGERDLILLRFVEGLSYDELAQVFDLPLGTIKWRIFNARKKLVRIIFASAPAGARHRIS